VQHGRTAWGARFAYISTDFHPGGMLELIENGKAILGAFKMIKDASTDWDGKNPIRRPGWTRPTAFRAPSSRCSWG
jgi:hypothetical protein